MSSMLLEDSKPAQTGVGKPSALAILDYSAPLFESRNFTSGYAALETAAEKAIQIEALKRRAVVTEDNLRFTPNGGVAVNVPAGKFGGVELTEQLEGNLTTVSFNQFLALYGERAMGKSLSAGDWKMLHDFFPAQWAEIWNHPHLNRGIARYSNPPRYAEANRRHLQLYGGNLYAVATAQYRDFTNETLLTTVLAILKADQEAASNPTLGVANIALGIERARLDFTMKPLAHRQTGFDLNSLHEGRGDGDATNNYSAGVTMSNSEAGDGATLMRPFGQRTSCRNSMYFGKAYDFKIIHRGIGNHEAVKLELQTRLTNLLDLTGSLFVKVLQNEGRALPTRFGDVVKAFEAKLGWDAESRDLVKLVKPEHSHLIYRGAQAGDDTLGALTRGLTFAATELRDIEGDQVADAYATLGGKLAIENEFMAWLQKGGATIKTR